MQINRVPTTAAWEPVVGYSRAVRVGSHVLVSGTVALDETGKIVAPGDAFEQARQALRIIQDALVKLGANVQDVCRTRVYLASITDWEAVGRAHGELFGEIKPASTWVEVSRLIHQDALVEIEVEAIVSDETD